MTADPQGLRRSTDDVVADLHREHALTLVRMANLLLRDQQAAEDVVQDAFISLYRAMPRLTDHDRILPYLRAAVINKSRSALRSRRRAWSGRYVLLSDWQDSAHRSQQHPVQGIDLVTGKIFTIPGTAADQAISTAW